MAGYLLVAVAVVALILFGAGAQASQKLAQAAGVMSAQPAALQLRLLQTVVEVAAEKNSTLVLPFPVELLRFLERSTPTEPPAVEAQGSDDGAGAGPVEAVHRVPLRR
jgi:hypothetical protein